MSTELHFGAFAQPLFRQLEGLGLAADVISCAQKDADAICRLRIRGFITDGVAKVAHRRLVARLEAVMREASGE